MSSRVRNSHGVGARSELLRNLSNEAARELVQKSKSVESLPVKEAGQPRKGKVAIRSGTGQLLRFEFRT